MNKKITMAFSKSTKGTHVYANSDTDAPVSTIYIKRSALPTDSPKAIELTISFGTEATDSMDEDLEV